jgi:hypothetical protein
MHMCTPPHTQKELRNIPWERNTSKHECAHGKSTHAEHTESCRDCGFFIPFSLCVDTRKIFWPHSNMFHNSNLFHLIFSDLKYLCWLNQRLCLGLQP